MELLGEAGREESALRLARDLSSAVAGFVRSGIRADRSATGRPSPLPRERPRRWAATSGIEIDRLADRLDFWERSRGKSARALSTIDEGRRQVHARGRAGTLALKKSSWRETPCSTQNTPSSRVPRRVRRDSARPRDAVAACALDRRRFREDADPCGDRRSDHLDPTTSSNGIPSVWFPNLTYAALIWRAPDGRRSRVLQSTGTIPRIVCLS